MKGSDFVSYLVDSAKKATCELRELVRKKHEEDSDDENIYPFEATFTSLVFHHLLEKCLKLENLEVESSYHDGRKRMDLRYSDAQSKEEYCIEIKTVLSLTKNGMLRKIRDGLNGINEDISRLKKLEGRQKKIMLVAYLGLGSVDAVTFDKWRYLIGETGEVTLKFC
jgi:hypothetical protein